MSKALQELAATVAPPPQPKAADPAKKVDVPLTTEGKFKALKAIEKKLNESFKTTASIIRLGSREIVPVPCMPTQLPTLDYEVFGCGGLPRGRIIELFGPESSGKTTAALHFIAQEQKLGNLCAFVDAEHALDPVYARKLGVDVDNLMFAQPDSGEQALETVCELVESKCVTLIVVDSVAALVPQAELDGEMGDSHMGLHARLMSQAMRKLRGICNKNGVTVIFINQIREKIGVMFGSPETTTGGRALKFYASVRLDVRKLGGAENQIKSGDLIIGHKMKVKAVKNKCGTPLRETLLDLIYGLGFDMDGDLITYASKIGALVRAGAWYSIWVPAPTEKDPKAVEELKAQGLADLKELLRINPVAMAQVKKEVAAIRKAQAEAEVQ